MKARIQSAFLYDTQRPVSRPVARIFDSRALVFAAGPPLFDRLNRLTLEEGTPDSKVIATLDWKLPVRSGSTGVSLRATRYGEVTEPGLPASAAEEPTLRDLVLDPTWLIDLTLKAGFFHDKLAVALGADNLFDQYQSAHRPGSIRDESRAIPETTVPCAHAECRTPTSQPGRSSPHNVGKATQHVR